MSKKVILVTGGAGFIGSHLCERLLEEGHKVICMDDLSTGSYLNIKRLINDPNFSFYIHDVRDNALLDAADPDLFTDRNQIYSLACPASPVQYGKNPLKTIDTNYTGTKNVLELARRVGSRVLLASTSEIYGEPLEHPQSETYRGRDFQSLTNPRALKFSVMGRRPITRTGRPL